MVLNGMVNMGTVCFSTGQTKSVLAIECRYGEEGGQASKWVQPRVAIM